MTFRFDDDDDLHVTRAVRSAVDALAKTVYMQLTPETTYIGHSTSAGI